MKIIIAGLGYVGLSNAVLLAQNNEVFAYDISKERVEQVNSKKSPIKDLSLIHIFYQCGVFAGTGFALYDNFGDWVLFPRRS